LALSKDIELKTRKITISEDEAMLRFSGGDARKLLNGTELVVLAEDGDNVEITNSKVLDRLQKNLAM
jgi:putative ATPase